MSKSAKRVLRSAGFEIMPHTSATCIVLRKPADESKALHAVKRFVQTATIGGFESELCGKKYVKILL